MAEPLTVPRDQLLLPQPFVAPRTPTEVALETIWRTALGMDRIGVLDDYQDLGGDSFLATIIFGMLGDAFGMAIPMAVLVESPTIERFAARIDALKCGG